MNVDHACFFLVDDRFFLRASALSRPFSLMAIGETVAILFRLFLLRIWPPGSFRSTRVGGVLWGRGVARLLDLRKVALMEDRLAFMSSS